MTYTDLSRRSFLGLVGGAAALTALTACGAGPADGPGAAGGAALPFQLGFLPDVGAGGYWLADDRGFYRDAHLTPDFLAGGPNAPAPEVVLNSGKAMLANESNTVRLFEYLSAHKDVVLIGTQYQGQPNGFLSLAKRPVRTPADLHGVRILAGPKNRPNMNALMKINKVTDFSFVPSGTDVGPLLQGEGDALLAFADNAPIVLQQQGMTEGKDYVFTPFSDLNYHLLAGAILVGRNYLEANRAKVVDFMRATARGFQAFITEPDAAAELAVKKYGKTLGLKLDQQKAAARAQVPYLSSDLTRSNGLLTLDVEKIKTKVYPTMTASGIANLPELGSVTDVSILAEVFKGGPAL
ncbi:ABC transporter substrate-binding protein [Amycolatopsis jejuensis]|uniref:ABC transporter substrate-binding protein n=1 Tax=Amycolatopsis jejuensis TaxID=330084 RepID=UPI0005245EC6|nr:ABC transporter substrate-binding protein [Amycolatopsis jejuensis]